MFCHFILWRFTCGDSLLSSSLGLGSHVKQSKRGLGLGSPQLEPSPPVLLGWLVCDSWDFSLWELSFLLCEVLFLDFRILDETMPFRGRFLFFSYKYQRMLLKILKNKIHYYKLHISYFLNIRVNCKLHPWHLGLFGFYTPKFQNLDFTPWSLVPLAIHPPRLVSAVNWHITMLTCFIFDKSALKLRSFNEK